MQSRESATDENDDYEEIVDDYDEKIEDNYDDGITYSNSDDTAYDGLEDDYLEENDSKAIPPREMDLHIKEALEDSLEEAEDYDALDD